MARGSRLAARTLRLTATVVAAAAVVGGLAGCPPRAASREAVADPKADERERALEAARALALARDALAPVVVAHNARVALLETFEAPAATVLRYPDGDRVQEDQLDGFIYLATRGRGAFELRLLGKTWAWLGGDGTRSWIYFSPPNQPTVLHVYERLVDGTRVTGVARDGGGFRVGTARGDFAAKEVVVATNGYTGALTPWMRRRVIPVGSYMVATEPLAPGVAREILPTGRMISDSKRVMAYYRLSPDGTRVLFGGRASFRPVSARVAAPVLHGRMLEIWPRLAGTRITHAWTGNVAFTFDFLPHMGMHEGVHYALGCQGSGVAMMSYLGNQLALKIAGGANRASAFDGLPFPTRPLYSGNPWFLPAVGLAYRVRDWLDRRAA